MACLWELVLVVEFVAAPFPGFTVATEGFFRMNRFFRKDWASGETKLERETFKQCRPVVEASRIS